MLVRPPLSVADVHYSIGHGHLVCQDYGNVSSNVDYGVDIRRMHNVTISDGCSSSPHTDIGARVLTHAAQNYVLGADGIQIQHVVSHAGNVIANCLGLPLQALDATLMTVQETLEGCQVTVWGDGVVVVRRRDTQQLEYTSISFSLNAPEYASYTLNTERHKAFRAMGGGTKTLTCSDGTVYVSSPPMKLSNPDELVFQSSYSGTFSRKEYDLVLVMSDGVESFQKKDATRYQPIPLAEVLAHVTDFKLYSDGFIQRRMHRFLTKFCLENNWIHTDDVTVGGIYMKSQT